jgi:hypothetical protein
VMGSSGEFRRTRQYIPAVGSELIAPEVKAVEAAAIDLSKRGESASRDSTHRVEIHERSKISALQIV